MKNSNFKLNIVLLLSVILIISCDVDDVPINQYMLSYNSNGATEGDLPNGDKLYSPGTSVTVSGNSGNLVKEGYYFYGWNTVEDGSGIEYITDSTLIMPEHNIVLFAQWRENTQVDTTNDDNTIDMFIGDYGRFHTMSSTSTGDIREGSIFLLGINTRIDISNEITEDNIDSYSFNVTQIYDYGFMEYTLESYYTISDNNGEISINFNHGTFNNSSYTNYEELTSSIFNLITSKHNINDYTTESISNNLVPESGYIIIGDNIETESEMFHILPYGTSSIYDSGVQFFNIGYYPLELVCDIIGKWTITEQMTNYDAEIEYTYTISDGFSLLEYNVFGEVEAGGKHLYTTEINEENNLLILTEDSSIDYYGENVWETEEPVTLSYSYLLNDTTLEITYGDSTKVLNPVTDF